MNLHVLHLANIFSPGKKILVSKNSPIFLVRNDGEVVNEMGKKASCDSYFRAPANKAAWPSGQSAGLEIS